MLPVSAADLHCQVTVQLLILARSFSVHNFLLCLQSVLPVLAGRQKTTRDDMEGKNVPTECLKLIDCSFVPQDCLIVHGTRHCSQEPGCEDYSLTHCPRILVNHAALYDL
jgi:hypothetical protein